MTPYARLLHSRFGQRIRSVPAAMGLLNRLGLPLVDHKVLRQNAEWEPHHERPDTFALVRIIGNDLFPRHRVDQNRENLDFILSTEPELTDCRKLWVVNRIFDRSEEQAICDLLELHGADYSRLPFNSDLYRRVDWRQMPEIGSTVDTEGFQMARYANKNAYVMNNNGARNFAIELGRKVAKWCLPWDGNCFLREDAWVSLKSTVKQYRYLKHFFVPMWRPPSRKELLTTDQPKATEEPQLIFRYDTISRFNEAFVYGRRPKVEMFWHLGIPGPWDFWKDQPWDPARRNLSDEAFAFGKAGWVARVPSGHQSLEKPTRKSFIDRGSRRNEAIRLMIDRIDEELDNN